MDFNELNLDLLYRIYEVYPTLIKNHKIALETSKDAEYDYIKAEIERLSNEFSQLKQAINNKYNGESNFSREYLFQRCVLLRKVLIFTFRPNSDAYNKFGKTIIGYCVFTVDESKELLMNSAEKRTSNGNVKIKLTTDDLEEDTRQMLEETGILTNDIFEIWQTS